MHIFKKVIIFSILLISFGLHSQVQLSPCRKQQFEHIIQVFNEALASELGTWPYKDTYGTPNYTAIDMHHIGHVITSQLPTIKSKIAQTVKHHLVPEEREMVINILNNLKKVSSITPEQVALIVRVGNDNSSIERIHELFMQRYPYLNEIFFFLCIQTEEQFTALCKQLSAVDCHDAALNFFKNFLLIDVILLLPMFILAQPDSSEVVTLKGLFNFFAEELSASPQGQGNVERISTLFEITHMVTSQLLDVISQ